MRLSENNISIVLLGAGRGTRMGDASPPKLLLPLSDGQPILRHAAQNALLLEPTELVVVVRPDLPAIDAALAGLPLRCVPNPRYMEGMGTSLALGVLSFDLAAGAVLVMLGDEPAVSSAIVQAIVDAYLREQKPITTPVYGDQPGPPTLFSRALFAELSTLQGDTGGRQLIARYPDLVCRVPFPQDARPRDVDTPEDYRSVADGRR